MLVIVSSLIWRAQEQQNLIMVSAFEDSQVGNGGYNMWSGHGGKGALAPKESKVLYGCGGYFPGKDATSSSSGEDGDGTVLIKVYL